ncbi:MAG: sigma-70 family RNA polymerase sigma factor [Bacteroidetes bacterium]|nr:sigma-70 family RNA polymerase sigma factor [Bacteroidota bacterium]
MEIILTDTQLTARFLEGDTEAFDELFRRFYPAVYSNALHILKDPAAADDVTQEIFISLWNKRGALRSPDNISGWLFVATSNRSINLLHKRLRERLSRHSPEDLELEFVNDDYATVEAQLRILQEGVAALSPQRKKVFQLCKLEGYSYEQAAAELGLSRNTVKEHMRDALESLRDFAAKHSGDAAILAALIQILSFL